jgi:predicted dehydrogenase
VQGAASINVRGANGRVIIGMAGAGRYCDTYIARYFPRWAAEKGNCRIGGVADVSKTCRAELKKQNQIPDCPEYADYRHLLDDRSIDAIFCSVEDCWHARVILDSLEAGKHVYVLPPLCRYLPEAFAIWDASVRANKIVQVGVYACSSPKWQTAAEVVRQGRLGPVVMVEAYYMRNTPRGEWNYIIPPCVTRDDVDESVWNQPGTVAPPSFDPERFFRWRKYYRFSSGLLSALLPHSVYPCLMAFNPSEFPRRVAAMGTKPVHSDSRTPGAGERDCPELIQVIAEFPSGATMCLTSSSVNAQGVWQTIRGHKASLADRGNKLELIPEPAFAPEIQSEIFGPFAWETSEKHFTNWLESIRGNEQPTCGIDLAVRAQVLLSMAEMSDRLNTVCLFDAATRTATDAFGKKLSLV